MPMRRSLLRVPVVLGLLISLLALVLPASAARVVAVGDLHGNLDRFRLALREAALLDAQDHWIGGKAVLVQTGDALDRGANTREVLDLLMSLQQEAARAGGKVVPLLGNHEVMNIVGDLRHVSPEEWASYADARSEARRQAACKEYVKWAKRRYPSLPAKSPREWLAQHPAGLIEHREAFGPKGKYGKWLRQHAAVAQVEDSIFLHGGIGPSTAALSIHQINDRVQAELRMFDSVRDHLLRTGAILPFFAAKEMVPVAQEELASYRLQLAALQTAPPGSSGAREDELREAVTLLEQFVAFPSWLIASDDGPLWFTGFGEWTEAEGRAAVPKILANYHARRFVTGHMPQNRIRSRWNGQVFLIDTSHPQPNMPGGRASALEIDDGITAIYQGERVALNPVSSPVAAATAPRATHNSQLETHNSPYVISTRIELWLTHNLHLLDHSLRAAARFPGFNQQAR